MNEAQLDLFPSLLLVSNLRSGRIDYCNKDALEFVGSSREDVVGNNVSNIISRASLIFFLKAMLGHLCSQRVDFQNFK